MASKPVEHPSPASAIGATPGEFARGFAAELITLGKTAVRPQGQHDRRGFLRVFELVRGKVEALQKAGDRSSPLYRYLVELRNDLRPSNNGAFDGFERLLRDQQLSMTSSPNPFYEEIELVVSESYAASIVKELPDDLKLLVKEAAQEFLRV